MYIFSRLCSSETILNKYHISFIYDVKKYLETLDYIRHSQGNLFIPAHTETTENIASLAEINRNKVHGNNTAFVITL